jgi:predicted nucleic acid-binding protein
MKRVFSDSNYWIALIRPGDQWADAAKAAWSLLGDALIVTTDGVLIEFLTALSRGEHNRGNLGEWRLRVCWSPQLLTKELKHISDSQKGSRKIC